MILNIAIGMGALGWGILIGALVGRSGLLALQKEVKEAIGKIVK